MMDFLVKTRESTPGDDHAETEWEPAMQSFILGDFKKQTRKQEHFSLVQKNFFEDFQMKQAFSVKETRKGLPP